MGGGGGTVQTSNTSSSTYDPAAWINSIAQGFGGQAARGFGGQYSQAGNISGLAPSQYNAAASNLGQAANMTQGAYNQAQNASTYNPSTFQNEFMNPYVNQVVNQMSLIGNRNFNQQVAPSLQAQFGGSGQFNSSRANQTVEQAQRDMQMNVLTNQQQAMNQAYQNSMGNYLQSMGVGVQGAQAMGGAAGTTGQIGGIQQALGQSAQMLPGNVFNSYAAGLANLPYGKTQQTVGTNVQPVQGGTLL